VFYLENSATTPLCREAIEAMEKAMQTYGNPSSVHTLGVEAHTMLENARSQVAAALCGRAGAMLKPGQLIFTSCGTEATSLAIFGSTYAKTRRTAKRIVTTDSEHPSVENALAFLAKDGFDVVHIPTKNGVLDMDALHAALSQPVALCTMMLVNNETGARYATEDVFAAVHKAYPEALCHCDAVQGFLKVPFTPATLGADMVTISSHKIHGPKGAGALYVSADVLKTKHLIPTMPGGGQENGLRSGTENTICLCGFGAAAAKGAASFKTDEANMRALRTDCIARLREMGLQVNEPAGMTAPHVVSVTLPNVKSETMLHHLSSAGVFVSAGSACSSHHREPSRTLLAFGLSPAQADSTLRISFGTQNTAADLDALCTSLHAGLERLVKIR